MSAIEIQLNLYNSARFLVIFKNFPIIKIDLNVSLKVMCVINLLIVTLMRFKCKALHFINEDFWCFLLIEWLFFPIFLFSLLTFLFFLAQRSNIPVWFFFFNVQETRVQHCSIVSM